MIKKNPLSEKWIKKYIGAKDYINNKIRYCLWLVDANPSELKQCPLILKRLEDVRNERMSSPAKETRKFADRPTLFCQNAQPDTDYLLIPGTTTQNRAYIPIGFLSKDVIASNAGFILPNATLYHFGILTSKIHMIWVKRVCGRLKSDIRYAKDIVYNNFPWCTPTSDEIKEIEVAAQKILDIRNDLVVNKNCTLADIYDKNTHTDELIQAHINLDKIVARAYGLKPNILDDENQVFAYLISEYQKIVTQLKK